MRSKLQCILTISLLITLAHSTAGCIYVPWFELKNHPEQTDFRPMLGPADSDKPLRVGHATAKQVRNLLGPPRVDGIDVLTYGIDTYYGFWVCPFLLGVDAGLQKGTIARLQFDQNGVLIRYDIESDADWFRLYDGDEAQQRVAAGKLEARGLQTPFERLSPASWPAPGKPR